MGDPRGPSVFGDAWYESAILVPEGQIFFARLISNRSAIYVLRLAKQSGTPDVAAMQAQYVTFEE